MDVQVIHVLRAHAVNGENVVETFRRVAIVAALKATDGNQAAAARMLGIAPSTLGYWINRQGVGQGIANHRVGRPQPPTNYAWELRFSKPPDKRRKEYRDAHAE